MNNRDKVLNILNRYPEARNDDVELTILLLEKYSCNSWLEKLILRRVLKRFWTPLSTIIRYRADYQNKKKQFEADEEIKRERQKHQYRKQQEFWIDYK